MDGYRARLYSESEAQRIDIEEKRLVAHCILLEREKNELKEIEERKLSVLLLAAGAWAGPIILLYFIGSAFWWVRNGLVKSKQ